MEHRIDHRSGTEVWFQRDRQQRPNLPASSCPFCPGGIEAPDAYDVRWFPDRWSPLPDGRCPVAAAPPHPRASAG